MNVLVIDDVDYIRKSISKVLDDNGFKCDSCENGKAALEKINEKKYDIIITDIMMPDMDGFEFLDKLRETKGEVARTPVLAISGGSKTIDSDLALKMINEKANGILQKPFSKSDLLEAIAKVVGNSRLNNVISNA